MIKKPRVLVLFSGGLDSILTIKILENQRVKTTGLFFKSYFFDDKKAKKKAKELEIPFKTVDFSKKHLEIVRTPCHGYGSALNPCIDCHKLMIQKAQKIKEKEGFDFIATGEVLGQRPMSQNKRAINLIEEELDLKGEILRPLSAKLLEKTSAEEKGLVKRERFFGIRGKSRKRQMELAKRFKIKDYPSPSGGCILTEKEFSKKLKSLFNLWDKNKRDSKYFKNNINLLKIGRHFDKGLAKIVVGKNEEENKRMEKIALRGDVLIKMKNYQGPLALVRFYKKRSNEIIKEAKKLTKYYSTRSRNKKDVLFEVKS